MLSGLNTMPCFRRMSFWAAVGASPPLSSTTPSMKQPERAAVALLHSGIYRDLSCVKIYADTALCRDLIEYCSNAAAGRIADDMDLRHCLQRCLNSSGQGSAVACDVRLDPVVISLKKDGAAVSSDISGHNNRVAGLCQCSGSLHAFRNDPDSGGIDEYAVHLAFSCNFGVSCHDLHAGFGCSFLHRSCDLLEFVHGESFLDDKSAGQIFGHCAHAGEVIYRSADREFPDVSACEKGRGYDKAVSGHSDPSLFDPDDCRVIRSKERVLEMSFEHTVDQF